MAVRLAELISTLSLATDLGMGLPLDAALGSCILATRLAQSLALTDPELQTTYYLALLRLVGCTADAHLTADALGDEREAFGWMALVDQGSPTAMLAAVARNLAADQPPLRRARALAGFLAAAPQIAQSTTTHCEVAQHLADRVGLPSTVQACLGQVFERWDGRGRPHRVAGEAIARPARVVTFAQDAILHCQAGGVDAAVAMARDRAGGAHDPAVVEAFCRDATGLLSPPDGPVWDAVLAAEPGPRPTVADHQLDEALRALADYADMRTPCLAGHSPAVGALAGAAAARAGLAAAEVARVRRAGFVHDLGRYGVSAGVWSKPGPLTESEWERVRLHPYYTERILSRPAALAPLGALAALHHERLDGSGYHRGALPGQLGPEARILAAADAYQAMTEPRPHRPARDPDQAADELRADVRAGRLDGEAVQAVLGAAGHRVVPTRRAWPAGLSDREVEVLRLVARGHSNRAIGEALVISTKTAGHHVQHIYDKIGVSTRAAAALFATQHDLLGPAPE